MNVCRIIIRIINHVLVIYFSCKRQTFKCKKKIIGSWKIIKSQKFMYTMDDCYQNISWHGDISSTLYGHFIYYLHILLIALQITINNIKHKHRFCPYNKISYTSGIKFRPYIITYFVSSKPYIEICRVCKIYGRRGGADPSIYFYKPDIVLCTVWNWPNKCFISPGPLFVYAVLRKIRKFIRTANKLTTRMLARKCVVASCATSHYDVIDPVWKLRLTLRFCGCENLGKSNITLL